MIKIMAQVERQVNELGAVIHCNTEVVNVSRSDRGWLLESRDNEGRVHSKTFDKLVVATGAFSRPAVPAFAIPFLPEVIPTTTLASEPSSSPIVIHTSHLSDPTVQKSLTMVNRKLVVVGASKSALDASERFSTLGHNVTLVLRNPPYLAPPAIMSADGPADAVAMVGTREKAVAVPFPHDVVSRKWASGGLWATLYRWLIHSSWLSSILHSRIIARSVAGFARVGSWSHPKLAPMIPRIGLMWSESSIFPGPEKFAHLVQTEKVRLTKGTVVNMEKTTIDGEEGFDLTIREALGAESHLFATAVIFGSGWRTGEYPFFDDKLLDELGLPMPYKNNTIPDREKEYVQLDRVNLRNVLGYLKTMRNMPSEWSLPGFSARFGGAKAKLYAPYRLYRLMVPLDSLYARDIAFAGIPTCKANHVMFICQAHWIADYFLDLLPRLPHRTVARNEISTQTVWAQRLFGPSHGRLGQWLGAMWIEYCSRLCWDMGVDDDGQGWRGVITSRTYDLDVKRAARDETRKKGRRVPKK